ncbi:MAG: dienelactone hydrolase [Pseudomonadota bacterium]
MNSLKRRLAAMVLSLLAAPGIADVGYTSGTLTVTHRDGPLTTHLWYPAEAGGRTEMLGKNAVFKGAPVMRNAPAAAGTYPLVVMSHGSGGNAPNLSWIASALAERGMVVIAANHPGTTSGDSQPVETVKLWERPADLSALIDAALTGPIEGIKIDAEAISALGFSLGGYSVLSLSGAAADPAAYADYCARVGNRYDCAWLAAGGVDPGALGADPRYAQPNTDARVRVTVAVDPALSAAYQSRSLASIEAQVRLINLGAQSDVSPGVNAAPLAPLIPDASLQNVAEAGHFSFLGLCTFQGAMIIRLAGEDPICSEPGSRPRAEIHRALARDISGFFASAFTRAGG